VALAWNGIRPRAHGPQIPILVQKGRGREFFLFMGFGYFEPAQPHGGAPFL